LAAVSESDVSIIAQPKTATADKRLFTLNSFHENNMQLLNHEDEKYI